MVAGLCHGATGMSLFGDILATVFERRFRQTPGEYHADKSLIDLADYLVGVVGETTGQSVAREILTRFDRLTDDEKLDFFYHLARRMNIAPDTVRQTLDAYEKAPSKATYRAFATTAEPPRQELIRRLNQVASATGRLVNMRADLLRLGRGQPELEALDLDFRHLFASWFNRGFLVLRPISWESPANILEKIIAYEAVHAIDSWDELRRRLEPADRRCFAFFHPAMPDEPLIFVEVALTKGTPGAIHDLLASDRDVMTATDADTAVFYSISNCQAGLASVSFGNSLIKQVVSDLSAALPQISTFVTLSPIPGLLNWLEGEGITADADAPKEVQKLAAGYLLNAKNARGWPVDPVARFHLSNGAQVHAVHAGADLSEKGRAQSAGAMVNYLYKLDDVAENAEAFATTQTIAAASDVKALADLALRQGA